MGIITDFIAILAGSILGLVIGNKIKESMRNIIMDSIGLFIIISGVKSTLESNRDITVLVNFQEFHQFHIEIKIP